MIINLTQHESSVEQKRAGVVDLHDNDLAELKRLLTFTTLPSIADVVKRALKIVKIAEQLGANEAMIAGAPYLIVVLQQELEAVGIRPLHSFTERISTEAVDSDNTVIKTSKFLHKGFVRI